MIAMSPRPRRLARSFVRRSTRADARTTGTRAAPAPHTFTGRPVLARRRRAIGERARARGGGRAPTRRRRRACARSRCTRASSSSSSTRRHRAAARPRPSRTTTCASANAATCARWVTHSTWCLPPKRRERRADGGAGLSSDPGIDLVEHEGRRRLGQDHAGAPASRGRARRRRRLGQRAGGSPVRGEEEGHVVRRRRRRGGADCRVSRSRTWRRALPAPAGAPVTARGERRGHRRPRGRELRRGLLDCPGRLPARSRSSAAARALVALDRSSRRAARPR